MPLPSAPDNANSLLLLEGGLTAISVAVAFLAPRLGNAWFRRIESSFGQLARKKRLSVVSVGLAALVLRLAILPLFPIPLPFIHDDFSHLLAADTFAHGRLTNPTPAMWTHFESFHVMMQPTYMSMYFPGEGLILAASKVVLGNPWFGILICSALMCAAICWMLQAWLPPTWALLGGILAVLRLGLFSYWVNTYSGGGMITGLGGALILGALPRLMKTARFRYGLVMSIGMVLLGLTRPYEGLLLCLPVVVALGHWALNGKNRPSAAVLFRRAALPVLLIVGAVSWLGYYDYRVNGKATTLPYTIDRATYAVAPYFVWQQPRPVPHYRYDAMRSFYSIKEMQVYSQIHSLPLFVPLNLLKIFKAVWFYAGLALIPPLLMMRRALMDCRIRFLVLCVPVLMAGMLVEIFMLPHYLAPFTAAFYAIGLQAMRHLRVWKPEGKPVGATMVRLAVTICFVMAGFRLIAESHTPSVAEESSGAFFSTWCGPYHFGVERARVQARLEALPGQQLAIVRYSSSSVSSEEWVYNLADIDGSKVVWAREMDATNNLELMRYYKNRKAWLVEPDTTPATVVPYPIAETPTVVKKD